MSIRVEDGRDPKVIVGLCEELYTGLPVPVPDFAQEGDVRPALVVVARRPDGGLLGWAEIRDEGDGASAARVQWLLVSRGRERITQGHHVVREVTAEERAVVLHLVRGAADSARRAGSTMLEWTDQEGHLDAQAAAALGATEVEELHRGEEAKRRRSRRGGRPVVFNWSARWSLTYSVAPATWMEPGAHP
ncbi:hypothetical protein IPZ61_02495 [Streptomyces sioyaensis]|uniref:hypothetical protein n=1 Tax=Streptomyces sioyaensis TaxID=67364 RepID=UPI001F1AEC86|nr:hypothetical protein [Streptomyces sioyaensis]MCF3172206.1 hypothetical protein [Streptomyces sioyaensis]